VADSASPPLKIFALYRVTSGENIQAVSSFLDFIYEDALSLTRVDYQELNIFKSFGFTSLNGEKKSFSITDLVSIKNVVYGELRAGLIDKCKISLKLWLRVKNVKKPVSYLQREIIFLGFKIRIEWKFFQHENRR
jgi:hypothetical protein